MKMLNDNQIMELLRMGNKEALELLFKKYYKLLTVSAFYILKDEMEAEDMVQTFFVDFWERQLFNNINSSLKAYLTTAIRNRCLKTIQKEAVRQKKLVDYQYLNSEIEEEEEFLEREINVDKILAELTVQRFQAVTLVHYQNKKYQEAAFEMGISINSLKTHLKLAFKTLRDVVKNER